MEKQETKKHQKKQLTGTVLSVKNQQTVIVGVIHITHHPKYQKAIKVRKRYAVHNEKFQLQLGDTVKISPTRPMSKTKHFQVCAKIES